MQLVLEGQTPYDMDSRISFDQLPEAVLMVHMSRYPVSLSSLAPQLPVLGSAAQTFPPTCNLHAAPREGSQIPILHQRFTGMHRHPKRPAKRPRPRVYEPNTSLNLYTHVMSNESKFPLKKTLGHECWLKLLGCVPRARASLERPDVLRL